MAAHNSFVTVLAETGLLGFSAYMMIIFYSFRNCRRMRSTLEAQGQQDGLLWALAQALPISLTGYVVTAMFISTTYYPQLFILSAMTNAALNVAIAQNEDSPAITETALAESGTP
jgi:O-antigen ligase